MRADSHQLISVEYDADAEEYVLMVTSFGRTEPAGARLFRAPPHPNILFRHLTRETADGDARKLQAYIGDVAPKRPSKAAMRKQHD